MIGSLSHCWSHEKGKGQDVSEGAPTSPPGLQLAELEHPATGEAVRVFAGWEGAFQHLRDHVLSAPESEAWRLLWPELEKVVDFEDDLARQRFLEAGAAGDVATVQPLYDQYAAAIRAEAGDASQLGWYTLREHTTACFGTSGVAIILQPHVRTAMVPGLGTPAATRQSRGEPALSATMWRHRPSRIGRLSDNENEEHQRERRERRRREAQWNSQQWLFYRVFRPAVQAVRQHHNRSFGLDGKETRSDMALLNGVLPPRSQLKFEGWQQRRQQCGRGQPTP